MAWTWYSVKTLYRTEAIGRPAFKDEDYDGAVTLVEERIVLFKARNFKEAILKAEKEARNYAADIAYENIYGQRVHVRYMETYMAYELFDEPGKGIEVFSDTELVNKRITDKSIIDRKMTPNTTENETWKRMKFVKGEITRAMLEHFMSLGEAEE
jgi:hypothetical protein